MLDLIQKTLIVYQKQELRIRTQFDALLLQQGAYCDQQKLLLQTQLQKVQHKKVLLLRERDQLIYHQQQQPLLLPTLPHAKIAAASTIMTALSPSHASRSSSCSSNNSTAVVVSKKSITETAETETEDERLTHQRQ
mmetsp:Transcript_60888/g.68131  ORF Transcript_60888/g.68131 Transcript_60888/m.68131 type:complete len:136 (+) Transcript_60888:700-1107(+)